MNIKKNAIKIMFFDSIFFNQNDYQILSDIFTIIDLMNNEKLKKLEIFLKKNNTKIKEKNRFLYELYIFENRNNVRLSTICVIYILIKIYDEDFFCVLYKFIQQQNYRIALHEINSILRSQNEFIKILNSINIEYEKQNKFINICRTLITN